ncbi:MAG: glutamine synthetase [Actinomycetia bacterium]|nr:glutamine synthetase [Actinomycetes bacterium]
MQQRQDYVLRMVEERRVRLVRLWFTDVVGQLKSVAISPVELESAFEEGVQFDGSAIDGFSRVQESDVLARPDPNSFQLMGADDDEITARIFCDIANLDGTPFEGDPRQVLRRNLAAAADAGFEFMCAPEVEFFYLAAPEPGAAPSPLDQASYFDLTVVDENSHIRRRTIQRLEATGIPVEYSFHEDAPSQHEIDLRYSDALAMADNVMALRMIVREVAMASGVHATFMPKPMEGVQGSGMHTHLSLWSADANAFHDPDVPDGLSEVARSFIAGVLAHAPELTAVTNQLVNSYKRLVAGFEAPVNISWAHNDRSALVRVPVPKRGKEREGTRVEYRALDPACNPYLAFSVLLAAGLKGIAEGYELGPESTAVLSQEAERPGTPGLLPANLAEALDQMERSELVRSALGEHIFEWFLRNKRAEWSAYRTHVSTFELDRYLRAW